jgi:hypothetical protein
MLLVERGWGQFVTRRQAVKNKALKGNGYDK